MIPDEAVQAARVKLEDVLGGWFDDLDAIRQILEAAAPYMQAVVRADVAESNREHLASFREWKPGDPVE